MMDLNTSELFAEDGYKRISPRRRRRLEALLELKGTELKKSNFDPSNLKVFVVGHAQYEQQVFRQRGYHIVPFEANADIVVWLGGEDINPFLYGEKPISQVRHLNPQRDVYELAFWRKSQGKFRVGICRGGQLLNVLNGGKLWQHVEGHGRPHEMVDLQTGEVIQTSSVHHQAFRPSQDAVIVATATQSTMKESEHLLWDIQTDPNSEHAVDHEVVWYPETRSLCFQGHPEYNTPRQCGDYFFKLLERYYPEQQEAA